jgi:asparagine synthase (glutamine-hydrolysing)
MCGICGIVNFNVTKPVDRHLVEQMTSAQAHRGPDDHGYFVDDNVGLGHCRLSIIDLSGGKQPIFNEDGSVVVVFNGEIYNYAGLTGDLVSRDIASPLAPIRKPSFMRTKNMAISACAIFAACSPSLAYWDRRRKRLLLVRDRLGIKPVYYYAGKDFFVFASEIKSLFEHPGVPREVDHQALDLYLALRYVPGPATMFKNIFKLQPGHWMTVDESGTKIGQYWHLNYRNDGKVDLEEFQHLLEESVRLRLISEVPLGVFPQRRPGFDGDAQ